MSISLFTLFLSAKILINWAAESIYQIPFSDIGSQEIYLILSAFIY